MLKKVVRVMMSRVFQKKLSTACSGAGSGNDMILL